MAQYNIFISHAWRYDDAYLKVLRWIEESNLSYKNYSVPKHDPLDANNTRKLKEMLTEQIRHASVVIIVAGMYAAYSRWIDYEIDEALRMGKKIIAIEPWDQQRVPVKVVQSAHRKIGWNSAPLIRAIRELCS